MSFTDRLTPRRHHLTAAEHEAAKNRPLRPAYKSPKKPKTDDKSTATKLFQGGLMLMAAGLMLTIMIPIFIVLAILVVAVLA